MKVLLGVAIFLIVAESTTAKVFTRCELAQELKRQGFNQISNWVCLIEAESGRNTAVKGGPNNDGSYDWGLYQINDRYWCVPGAVGGDCRITCQNLLTDDITVASNCAKMIWNRHGWTAWNGWKAKCQGALPDLSSCGV
ncbi:lysozyme-like [Arctopsyche grandis]|uniref:lysozyme-like n=1 Tax=Arctopsyche grandis TaxID=121162 RepID=UPI00406D7BA4